MDMTTDAPAAVDERALRMLEELMGEEGFQEILQVFREDTQLSLQQLEQALQHHQTVAAKAICHRLKSSCKLVGASQMAELVTELEQVGGTEANGLLDGIRQEYRRVIHWMNQQ